MESKCYYKEYCKDYIFNEMNYNLDTSCWKNPLECPNYINFIKDSETFARIFFTYMYP